MNEQQPQTYNEDFSSWRDKWQALAEFEGDSVPDVLERTQSIVRLLSGTSHWHRKDMPPRLLSVCPWYSRGDRNKKRTGEHEIEFKLFAIQKTNKIQCVKRDFFVLANAYPLAHGRRVEADVVAVACGVAGIEIYVVEAKHNADNPWYALVENLRQVKLFQDNLKWNWEFLKKTFSEFLLMKGVSKSFLETTPPVRGMVLAPPVYYTKRGQKSNAVQPAQELVNRVASELNVQVLLTKWQEGQTIIEPI